MPKTLLVVDDSATMRKVFELTLAGEGLTIVTHDGGDGLLARARDTRPSAAVVDVNLGGPNGYDVCRALKADPALKGISVILVYSEQSPLDEMRAREAGSDGSLLKPFDSQMAIDKIRQALGGAPAPAVGAVGGTAVMGGVAPPPATGAPAAARVAAPPGPPGPAVRSPTSAGIGSIGTPPAQAPKATQMFAPAVLSSAPVAPPKPRVEPPDADIVLEMDSEDEAVAAAVTTPQAPVAPVVRAPSPPQAAAAPVPAPAQAVPAPAPHAPAPPATSAPVPAPAPAAAAAVAVSAEVTQRLQGLGLSSAQVDAVAALTREVVERVVWEVVPQLAETLIREEIRRLTAE